MKRRTILFTAISLLLLLGEAIIGCQNDINKTYPDAIIVKELPKMYIQGNIKQGDVKIVHSKKELLALFSQSEIDKVNDLATINFSTQTLLIGCDNYASEANFRYKFSKNKETEYNFSVEINGMVARPEGYFLFGIIVKKLPQDAKVSFNIVKR